MIANEAFEDVPAAGGTVKANPQFGMGGSEKIYIPEYEGKLKPIHSVILTNTKAE